MSTGIVILAAGESARMGEPKQLLAFRGTTLLRQAIDTALALAGAPVAVVLGAHAAEIRAQLDEPRVLLIENPHWREGMGGSLRTGLGALLTAHQEISAVIFLVCDQPFLDAATLRTLISTHATTHSAIVAAEYGGTLGVPALFARALFPELLAVKGDAGARQIIRAHREQAIGVPFPDGAVDIDTPADFSRLQTTSTPTLG